MLLSKDHRQNLARGLENLLASVPGQKPSILGFDRIRATRAINPAQVRVGRCAQLILRIESSDALRVNLLSRRKLCVGEVLFTLGGLNLRRAPWTPSLLSEYVTTKGAYNEQRFFNRIQANLIEFGIQGAKVVLSGHRCMYINGHSIIGHRVTINDLNEVNALTLLRKGLGGRRRYGAGFFRPVSLADER